MYSAKRLANVSCYVTTGTVIFLYCTNAVVLATPPSPTLMIFQSQKKRKSQIQMTPALVLLDRITFAMYKRFIAIVECYLF